MNNTFKPTFLYIKQHAITGLLYFGKTCQTRVEDYKGSGKYWNLHLRKHTSNITTLWYCLYLDQEELTRAAILFSNLWNIALSDNWANLKPENGIDGTITGTKLTKEAIAKRTATRKANGCKPSRESIRRGISTKKINGTLNTTSPESIAKREMTKKSNNIHPSPEAIAKRVSTQLKNGLLNKKCTVDGVTIFVSRKELVRVLGQGLKGLKHPNFRYLISP